MNLASLLMGSVLSICGPDNRVPTHDPRIGRIKLPQVDAACTATLISKNCAITAGHCLPHLKTVEFNLPSPEVYDIDMKSVVSKKNGVEDWAVFRIKASQKTKRFPGDSVGFYPVNFNAPKAGEEISISGYGKDLRGDGSRNYTLQVDTGVIESTSGNTGRVITYKIDTAGGNSGSALIRTKEQDIVGIHTNGDCNSSSNFGTVIYDRPDLKAAILACQAGK